MASSQYLHLLSDKNIDLILYPLVDALAFFMSCPHLFIHLALFHCLLLAPNRPNISNCASQQKATKQIVYQCSE
jgi:hypothetical protein